MQRPARVVILGGGFGGAYCARTLERIAGPRVSITLVDRQNYLLFYPLLVEAGTGHLEPRHAAVPLRRFLRHSRFRMGHLVSLDTARSLATVRVASDRPLLSLPYDHLVVAVGSVTRLPNVPGLREYGFRMKSLADAVTLRDRVIRHLEIADATPDPAERRSLLHFVVVGGNFTGVEVAGEYQAWVQSALRRYPRLNRTDVHFTLIEKMGRLLPALEPPLADYARTALERRGISIRLNEDIQEIEPEGLRFRSGERMLSRTIIWCAGVAPNPILERAGLPLRRGAVACENDLRVVGHPNIWAVGDCAAIPDPAGRPYPPTAQMAVRQGEAAARNIDRILRDRRPLPCVLRSKGSLTPLGGRSGVGQIGNIRVSGFPAWVLFRLFYLTRMPGAGRRLRVAADWLTSFFSATDDVQLGVHDRRPVGVPERRQIEEAAPR